VEPLLTSALLQAEPGQGLHRIRVRGRQLELTTEA
jgi:hypothetical protein